MSGVKRKGIKQWIILVIALPIILVAVGCATCPKMPLKPVKPSLTTEIRPDGGICLDRDNTMLLLDYLWRLEEGYE